MTMAAGLITSILFSFLFTAALSMTVKDSVMLKNLFGIEVDLNDNVLSPAEWMPAVRAMVSLWLFFALMRIVHHNVDMIFALVMGFMPNEATKVLKLGGL